MKKILITGGAGFIGFFLAKHLAKDQNSRITIVDNLQRGRIDEDFKKLISLANITFVNGDLTDKSTLDQLEREFHYIYHHLHV